MLTSGAAAKGTNPGSKPQGRVAGAVAFPSMTRESTHSALLGRGRYRMIIRTWGGLPSTLGLHFPVASGTFPSLTLAILVVVDLTE